MNATYYFFGLIGMTLLLFVIAWFLPKIQKQATLSDLYTLSLSVLGNGFSLIQSDKFITIKKNNQKIALLTLDKELSTGARKLGDSIVINFKKLPSKKLLEQYLINHKIIALN